MTHLCSKERTIEGFAVSQAPPFSLFPPLSFPQGEGVWERFFIHLTMPSCRYALVQGCATCGATMTVNKQRGSTL